jgi:hypothetical protein
MLAYTNQQQPYQPKYYTDTRHAQKKKKTLYCPQNNGYKKALA